MKVLVIAEKNQAARRIAYILSGGKFKTHRYGRINYYSFERDGKEYYVVGLRGHIVELDYPEDYSSWNENPDELIDVEPIKVIKVKSIANLLKKIYNEVDEVIIATDYDREGELIGLEALEILNLPPYDPKVKRARFSALTKEEIENAFANPVKLDLNLAKAAEVRQKVDLLWGSVLTRYLSVISNRRGRDFISAGRVQSPTLCIVVNREEEIEKFEKKPYWKIYIDFGNFSAESEKTFWDENEVKKIIEKIKKEGKAKVIDFTEREKIISKPAPFNTTQFLQASWKLGIPVGRAMKIAEDLYTTGYISYPRTDNTTYPPTLNLREILKKLSVGEFAEEAKEILSEGIKPSRGKYDTKDHPPIHPVRGAKKGEIPSTHWKIYELVVRRFFATLAKNGRARERKIILDVGGEKFIAKGLEIIDRGWLKYYPYVRIEEKFVPKVDKNSLLKFKKVSVKKDYTKPPSRYSQGTLVEEMEKLGLGTKSTRHEIIEKLIQRGYITSSKTIRPTKLGITVAKALEENDVDISKPDMTAKLESDMSAIAYGKIDADFVYNESKELLRKVMSELKERKDELAKFLKEGATNIYGKCPKCGENLVEVRGMVRCEGCGTTYKLPRGSVKSTEEICPYCSLPLIEVRRGRVREKRCLDPKCEYNQKKDYLGKCPKCGGDLLIRWSQGGKRFVGCSNYPECDYTLPLPQKGLIIPAGTCEDGSPKIIVIQGKRRYPLCLKEKK